MADPEETPVLTACHLRRLPNRSLFISARGSSAVGLSTLVCRAPVYKEKCLLFFAIQGPPIEKNTRPQDPGVFFFAAIAEPRQSDRQPEPRQRSPDLLVGAFSWAIAFLRELSQHFGQNVDLSSPKM